VLGGAQTQIIAESGADTVEYFNKVVKGQHANVVAFSEQGKHWLEHLRKRKCKPIALSTIERLGANVEEVDQSPYRRLSRL
jgi:hypothetical protein